MSMSQKKKAGENILELHCPIEINTCAIKKFKIAVLKSRDKINFNNTYLARSIQGIIISTQTIYTITEIVYILCVLNSQYNQSGLTTFGGHIGGFGIGWHVLD